VDPAQGFADYEHIRQVHGIRVMVFPWNRFIVRLGGRRPLVLTGRVVVRVGMRMAMAVVVTMMVGIMVRISVVPQARRSRSRRGNGASPRLERVKERPGLRTQLVEPSYPFSSAKLSLSL
jgi:hypothetical protein